MSNQTVSNTWPTARGGARFAARDLAMLDNFVAAALAEADDDGRERFTRNDDHLEHMGDHVEHMEVSHAPVPDTGDDAEAFLQRTIAFLSGRADRAQLLERLRDVIMPPAPISAEPPAPTPAAAAQPETAAPERTPE